MSSGKVIAGEIIAEIVVPFVRTFIVLVVLGSFGGTWAAVASGLIIYGSATLFGLEMNLVGDVLPGLQLFAIKGIDNRKKKTALTTRTIVIIIVKLILDIVMPMLAGLAYRWVAAGSLPLGYQIINQIPANGGWATYVMLGIVVMLAYHVIVFLYIFTRDGFGSSLSIGVTYFVVSLVSYILIHGFLDMGANIALAFAIFPTHQAVDWWYMLATYVIAGILTVILYYLLWNFWFSAESRRANLEQQMGEDMNGLADERKQAPEEMAQSSKHFSAMSGFLDKDA